MNRIKNIAFSALLSLGAFSAITYTACNKDECKDVVCQNGGTCVSGTCSCPTGYEGNNCETKSRDKFIGTYIGQENCTIGNDNYTITVTTSSENIKLIVTNLYNQGFTATGTMTASNTFSLSGSQGSTSYTGTGSLANNQLTIQYSITSPAATNSCTFVGTKQ
jgi:hypothetical protein